MGYVLLYLALLAVQGGIFGFATATVIDNKGYHENWFWWGFFFGLIALIVACAKPQNTYQSPYRGGGLYQSAESAYKEQVLTEGGWKCSCGRVQPKYVSTCSCGMNRRALLEETKKEREEVPAQPPMGDREKAAAIREYKQLMDAGILSAEEFEAKKKQLLGI